MLLPHFECSISDEKQVCFPADITSLLVLSRVCSASKVSIVNKTRHCSPRYAGRALGQRAAADRRTRADAAHRPAGFRGPPTQPTVIITRLTRARRCSGYAGH